MELKKNKKLIIGMAVIIALAVIGIVGALNGWWGGGGSIPEDTFTRGLVGYWPFDEGITRPPGFFEDGFESGDFSAWDGTTTNGSNTISVVNTSSYHGSYSTKHEVYAYTNSSFEYKNISDKDSLYVRAYWKTPSSFWTENNDRYARIIEVDRPGVGLIASIGVKEDNSGNIRWMIEYLNGGSSTQEIHSTEGPATSTWYSLELYTYISGTNGETKFWVNGQEVLSKISLDNNNNGNVNRVFVGYYSGNGFGGGPYTWYTDSVVVSNSYIGSEKVAYDTSDYGNNGDILGATATTGKKGAALDFDGVNDYVNAGTDSSMDPPEVTVEAWFKRNVGTDTGFYIIIDRDYGYRLMITNTEILWRVVDSGWKNTESTATSSDTWYHAVGIYDSSYKLTLYVNGMEIDTLDGVDGIDYSNDKDVVIGAHSDKNQNYFNGTIDEVRIYNRVLSATEIRYHYNRGGPVGYWKFNEGEGTTAYDNTDNDNDGTLGNGTCTPGSDTCPTWVEGKHDSALDFDGNDDYVEVSDNSSLDMTTNDFTICSWIKHPDTAATRNIISKKVNQVNYVGYLVRITNTGKLDSVFSRSAASSLDAISVNDVDTGNWVHICVVYDRDGNLENFINGSSDGTVDISGSSSQDCSNNVDLTFGIGTDDSGAPYTYDQYPFDGTIDDVRIYNYARTPAQILQDYNAGLSVHFK